MKPYKTLWAANEERRHFSRNYERDEGEGESG